jgi:hypothetical protein
MVLHDRGPPAVTWQQYLAPNGNNEKIRHIVEHPFGKTYTPRTASPHGFTHRRDIQIGILSHVTSVPHATGTPMTWVHHGQRLDLQGHRQWASNTGTAHSTAAFHMAATCAAPSRCLGRVFDTVQHSSRCTCPPRKRAKPRPQACSNGTRPRTRPAMWSET